MFKLNTEEHCTEDEPQFFIIVNVVKEQIAESDWNMDYVEYRIIRKDGAVRYLKDYGHLEEGEGKGADYFQVFLLDVTDDPESDT